MTANKCHCGAAVQVHEDGDLRCLNGHPQRELLDGLAKAMAELVRVHLCELREEIVEKIDMQGVEIQSLREDVKALRLEPTAADYNDTATEAKRIKRSKDWLRDHARELGGTQRKPRARWRFVPAVTDARLAALEDGGSPPARWAPPQRPLPESVPLLDVKDRAA
jgi:hypothetical protein